MKRARQGNTDTQGNVYVRVPSHNSIIGTLAYYLIITLFT